MGKINYNFLLLILLTLTLTSCSHKKEQIDLQVSSSIDCSKTKIEDETNLINFSLSEYSNISELSKYPDLKQLLISEDDDNDGQMTSLNGIETLKSLTSLTVTDQYITDISDIKLLTNLNYLDVSTLQLDNNSLDALQNLTNLEDLRLAFYGDIPNECLISDITVLSKLEKLKNLVLVSTNITDFSPLYSLDNLEQLSISSSISEDLADEIQNNLPKCKVILI